MKFHLSILTLLASCALVSSQDFPECPRRCITAAITDSGCSSTDWACICSSQIFWDEALPCTVGSCTQDDANAALTTLANICGFIGS
ncbi:hypothetical protein DL96DRAFT_1606875 [Flagelloscypha sp. PMI_526]|nr:hypothetical protein DL96DRAFT_1606875 [Flagelloscypha sp. PMI_526]